MPPTSRASSRKACGSACFVIFVPNAPSAKSRTRALGAGKLFHCARSAMLAWGRPRFSSLQGPHEPARAENAAPARGEERRDWGRILLMGP